MKNINISNLKVVPFSELEDVIGLELGEDEIPESGTYWIINEGCGYYEVVDKIGELDLATIQVMNKGEAVRELYTPGVDSLRETRENVRDFYFIEQLSDQVKFGYTEQGYDVYIKIQKEEANAV